MSATDEGPREMYRLTVESPIRRRCKGHSFTSHAVGEKFVGAVGILVAAYSFG
jgi:hypothetical protein